MHTRALILAVGVLVSLAITVAAETPVEKGLRLFQEAHSRDRGFGDWRATLTMQLRNQQGDSSARQLRMQGLENPADDDGDKTLIIFDLPPDVKGTALLSHTHILRPDDQWLFLPALARVKRISSGNKSGPFVGSEFAYEDFTSQEVAKFTYKWLRDEPCGDLSCAVVERYPQYENSGYTRQIVWLDAGELRPQKVEYFDRKDQLLKTLELRDYRLYRERHWRAAEMAMRNDQNGKSTTLTWSAYEFGVGLSAADFTETALKRVR